MSLTWNKISFTFVEVVHIEPTDNSVPHGDVFPLSIGFGKITSKEPEPPQKN